MPIETPTRRQVQDRSAADLQAQLPDLDLNVDVGLSALSQSLASRNSDFYDVLQQLVRELFLDTSNGDFLLRWGLIANLTRNSATTAVGDINVTGTNNTEIPANSILTSSAGNTYRTRFSAIINDQNVGVSTLVRNAELVTATTLANHTFASGQMITISGANEAEFNGTFEIVRITANSFEYEASGSTGSGTGTIVAAATYATVSVESQQTGQNQNLVSGTRVTVSSTIAGADNTAFVGGGNVSGGTNQETEDQFRERIRQRLSTIRSSFSVSAIEAIVRSVAGVTRVFISPVTPTPGAVTVRFVRDNDASIFPDASEIETVRNAILVIKPVNISDADVIVESPDQLSVDFNFNSITPNTAEMRSAVRDKLTAFFQDQLTIGVDITQDAYRCAIQQTFDQNNTRIQSFDLQSPIGNISVSNSQLATLGQVTFS